MKIQTPWGAAQSSRKITEGIAFHSTTGHGGYELSSCHWAHLMARLPGFNPWAGEGWLEEDCDATAVPLCFPEFFTDQDIFFAVKYARLDGITNRDSYRAFLASLPGEAVAARADAFALTVADKWEAGGCCTQSGGWCAFLVRGKDRKSVWMPDYPSAQFYSDSDLAALPPEPIKPEPKRAPRAPSQVHFDESQCGGVFDGFGVTSDADPGL